MKPREYTKKYTFPDHDFERAVFATQLIKPYRLVVGMGLPCTGKSTFFQYVQNTEGCLTVWSRQTIFEMLFQGGERDEKYNSYIAEFEKNMFTSLFGNPEHKVCVEGWFRKLHTRVKTRELLPRDLGRALLIVFDGPPEEICARMSLESKYANLDPLEIEEKIANDLTTMQWPTVREGYDVVYLNMFGAAGAEYLKIVAP